jgi:hypothetical protein
VPSQMTAVNATPNQNAGRTAPHLAPSFCHFSTNTSVELASRLASLPFL